MFTYIIKENEVKMVRPKCSSETGDFLGIYETVGFMVVRGSPEEVFFNYGYDKEKSNVLYAYYRRRISNFFSGTMIERGEADAEFSNIFFFSLLLLIETRKLINISIMFQFFPLMFLKNNLITGLVLNLILQSLTCLEEIKL